MWIKTMTLRISMSRKFPDSKIQTTDTSAARTAHCIDRKRLRPGDEKMPDSALDAPFQTSHTNKACGI